MVWLDELPRQEDMGGAHFPSAFIYIWKFVFYCGRQFGSLTDACLSPAFFMNITFPNVNQEILVTKLYVELLL